MRARPAPERAERRARRDTALPSTSIDPVCGMTVTTDSPHVHDHHGEPVYFCCAGCKAKFVADPDRYIEVAVAVEPMAHVGAASSRLLEDTHPSVHAKASVEAPPQPRAATAPVAALPPPGTTYTCPMHPEVRQDRPGACPKCGMALEPELPALDEGDAPELVDFRRRFWWTLPLTLAVAAVAMLGDGWLAADARSWVELALALPVFAWAGGPFLVRGVRSISARSPNMWTLIALGTSAAFFYSVVATLAPQVFPSSFRVDGRIEEYFDAAAVII